MLLLKEKSGFTLVELSIVIVIIALIIAGVSAGSSLVKNSRLQAVITEAKQYQQAVNSFYVQYNALPGDMSNAYSYWGSNCAGSASACNGTGNGRIYYYETSLPATSQEVSLAWRHLYMAGLIPRSYTLMVGDSMTVNVSAPGSNFNSNACWFIDSNHNWNSIVAQRNRLNIGSTFIGLHCFRPLFAPKESQSIDSKIDDGIPFTGKVVSTGGYTTSFNNPNNCFQGSGSASTYQLTYTSAGCHMMFELVK